MSAHVRVRLLVEFPLDDSWGDDCKVGQVYEQAASKAHAMASEKFGPFCKVLNTKVEAIIQAKEK